MTLPELSLVNMPFMLTFHPSLSVLQIPYHTSRYWPNYTVLVKKRYKLISEFVSVKYRSVPLCIGEYWTILIFSIKYRPMYTNLNKILNFDTLIFVIFWNSKQYEPSIAIRKFGISHCGKKRYNSRYDIYNFGTYS